MWSFPMHPIHSLCNCAQQADSVNNKYMNKEIKKELNKKIISKKVSKKRNKQIGQ